MHIYIYTFTRTYKHTCYRNQYNQFPPKSIGNSTPKPGGNDRNTTKNGQKRTITRHCGNGTLIIAFSIHKPIFLAKLDQLEMVY